MLSSILASSLLISGIFVSSSKETEEETEVPTTRHGRLALTFPQETELPKARHGRLALTFPQEHQPIEVEKKESGIFAGRTYAAPREDFRLKRSARKFPLEHRLIAEVEKKINAAPLFVNGIRRKCLIAQDEYYMSVNGIKSIPECDLIYKCLNDKLNLQNEQNEQLFVFPEEVEACFHL